jgi:hypothetical protein
MMRVIVAAIALLVQNPRIDDYQTGELVRAISPQGKRYYEYRINVDGDGYMGRSSKPVLVTKGSKVKFTIRGRSLYIIDTNGKVHKLRYVIQYLIPPPPPPPKEPRGENVR